MTNVALLFLKKRVQFFVISKEMHNFAVKLDKCRPTKTREHSDKRKDKKFLWVKGKVGTEARLEKCSDGFCQVDSTTW